MDLQAFQPQPVDVFRIAEEIEKSRLESEAANLHERWLVMPAVKPENQMIARCANGRVERYLQFAKIDIALVPFLQRRNEVLARHGLKPQRHHRPHSNRDEERNSCCVQRNPEPSLRGTPRSAHIPSITFQANLPGLAWHVSVLTAPNEQTARAHRYTM